MKTEIFKIVIRSIKYATVYKTKIYQTKVQFDKWYKHYYDYYYDKSSIFYQLNQLECFKFKNNKWQKYDPS